MAWDNRSALWVDAFICVWGFFFCVQKDQLNLQCVDILSLRESLHMEQQRYRHLWDERETVVTCLHSQIHQLQHDRNDYYTKYQELQVTSQTRTRALFWWIFVSLPTWLQTRLSFMKSYVKSLIMYVLILFIFKNFFLINQSKMQECQKRMGEMEAELQKANNKVCHMGHQLNQLTAKVKITLHTLELQLK